jgi:uncharacterized membrane protein YukC
MSKEFLIKNNDANNINKLLQDQSDQMLTLVDIINVYDKETQNLKKTISNISSYNQDIINNQMLLFITLVSLLIYFIYIKFIVCDNKIN